MYLMGKTKASFERHILSGEHVEILNASKLTIEEKKFRDKEYATYSGYPGGLKHESMEHLARRRGYGEVLRRAIYNMLPTNKLRPKMLKRLIVKE